ncbi:hypothetical protein BH10BAC2_BH10BAC2_02100 [soil metagenome]
MSIRNAHGMQNGREFKLLLMKSLGRINTVGKDAYYSESTSVRSFAALWTGCHA